MTNKYITMLCITTLMFCFKTLSAQNLNIVYVAKSFALDDMLDYDVDIEYMTSLKINNGKSIYSRDSLILKSPYPQKSQEMWTRKNIIKDYNNDVYIIESAEFQRNHLYETKISTSKTREAYEWEITKESQIICDQICTKATSGFDTIWYTVDLPYSDGPHLGVFDIQGLILKYKSLYGIWEAISIDYEHVSEITIPDGKRSSDKNSIKLSYGDIFKLDDKSIIIINDKLELNKYVTF